MKNFNDIPQEKFDNMNKVIEKSKNKEIKNLKINYIDIQDFKNIDGISTELYDWNIIGGYNGNGKSSFVEAILTAIKGQKFIGTSPASLVKSGENKASINLSIKGEDIEIILERVFKSGTSKNPTGKTELNATMNGNKISQKSLDELLNALTLDPLKLGNLSITEQIKEIKNTTGLNTDEIDKQIKDQEEIRKEARQYKESRQAVYEEFTAGGVPEKIEKVNLNELLEIQKGFNKLKEEEQELENKKEEFKVAKNRVEELEKELILAKENLEKIKKEGKELSATLKDKKDNFILTHGSEEYNNNSLNNAQEINEKAEKYNKFLEAKNERDIAIKSFKEEEEKLEELRKDRTKIISESNLPEYMEISDEFGILVDGIEYKLLNTAKKIEVAIDLILISGSPLRMIRLEEGSELDLNTLSKIKEKILKNNFQIFIERVNIDKYDSIIISDGELLEGQEKENFINNQ